MQKLLEQNVEWCNGINSFNLLMHKMVKGQIDPEVALLLVIKKRINWPAYSGSGERSRRVKGWNLPFEILVNTAYLNAYVKPLDLSANCDSNMFWTDKVGKDSLNLLLLG